MFPLPRPTIKPNLYPFDPITWPNRKPAYPKSNLSNLTPDQTQCPNSPLSHQHYQACTSGPMPPLACQPPSLSPQAQNRLQPKTTETLIHPKHYPALHIPNPSRTIALCTPTPSAMDNHHLTTCPTHRRTSHLTEPGHPHPSLCRNPKTHLTLAMRRTSLTPCQSPIPSPCQPPTGQTPP